MPGVGVKSASRMAFHLLQHDRAGAQMLARPCSRRPRSVAALRALCHTFTEDEVCATCLDPRRDAQQAVRGRDARPTRRRWSAPAAFRGLYFVLMGKLSPLDGIGPKDIGLAKLFERATDGVVQEVILATNFTAEGEATAHVISEALKARGLNVTRLARGVPAGSELEYVDLGTIAHALVDRR